MTLLDRLHPYAPAEPRPAPLPAMRPGLLCAPCDVTGGRVGAWIRLRTCLGGCHLVAHWSPDRLYASPIHGVILWDGAHRWCTMPMGVPLDHDDDEGVEIPFGPVVSATRDAATDTE